MCLPPHPLPIEPSYSWVAMHRALPFLTPSSIATLLSLPLRFSSSSSEHLHPTLFLGDSLRTLCLAGYLDEALHAFPFVHASGVCPPDELYELYVCFLKACQRAKSLTHVKLLVAYLFERHHHLAGKIGDYVVITLIKCGGIQDAIQVFYSLLPQHSIYSWTALITGITDSGKYEEALRMQEYMQQEGFEPNHFTFVSLLKACGNISCLREGRKLHAAICKKGLDSDVFVSSSLITMYSKCTGLMEAENVFIDLYNYNVVSWNAMLSAYLQHGQVEKVLQLYGKMVADRMDPNDVTFTFAIQACGLLAGKEEPFLTKGNMEKSDVFLIGRALHADARKNGFSEDVGNALVKLYGKCLSISDAHNVVYTYGMRSVASWNAMISTYVEVGHGESALRLFRHMLKESINPDAWSFVIILQACCIIADKEETILVENHFIKPISPLICEAINKDAERRGFTSHIFVQNTLLTTYSKCGSISKANKLFSECSQLNVISWNAMLSAYVGQGQGAMALHLYRQMQEEGVQATEETFTITIQACMSVADNKHMIGTYHTRTLILMIGKALHADAVKKGYARTTYVGNTIVSMYGKYGMVVEAEHVFQDLVECNVVSWNTLLSAYVDNRDGETALQLFKMMQQEGINPNKLTIKSALWACSILANKGVAGNEQSPLKDASLKILQALHDDIERKGLLTDALVGSTLINIYSKYGRLVEAESVFERLSHLDDVMPWNAMLSAFVENNLSEEVLQLFRKFQSCRVADDVTFILVLQACGDHGCIDFCRELHFTLVCIEDTMSLFMITTLIHSYGNCGSMIDAEASMNELYEHDVVTWSACITGYAREGNFNASVHILKEMELTGCMPNRVTFLSLLNNCSHAGLLYIGLQYFTLMQKDYGISPDFRSFAGMVDLIGRAGDFIRLENMLKNIPVDNETTWLCMLGACHIHGNTEFGIFAFQHAQELQLSGSF